MTWLRIPINIKLTPDGQRYQRAGRGQATCIPFHLRWFLPWALGANEAAWAYVSRLSIVALFPLAYVYIASKTESPATGLLGAFLLILLPQFRFMWKAPILVDAPAMCMALLATVLPSPHSYIAMLLGATMRETVPVWAAIYTWNPWMLCGLVVPAVRWLLFPAGVDTSLDGDAKDAVKHPFRTSMAYHRDQWLSMKSMLLPWGMLLVGWMHPSWQLCTALACGYLPLVGVTDTARVYVWAAPVLAVAAAPMLLPYAMLAVAVHACNPWAGHGI